MKETYIAAQVFIKNVLLATTKQGHERQLCNSTSQKGPGQFGWPLGVPGHSPTFPVDSSSTEVEEVDILEERHDGK